MRFGDVPSHFIAARPDAGPHGGPQIPRARVEAFAKRRDGRRSDPYRRAPPSGVNRGDGPPLLIDEKKRQAIRRFDDQEKPRRVRNQRVAGSPVRQGIGDGQDGGRMDLAEQDGTQSMGRGQRGQVRFAEPARSEPMEEPGDFAQSGVGREGIHLLI